MSEGEMSDTRANPLPSGSDVVYDFYCEPCHDEGHNMEAFGFCQDCEEYLCSDCYHGHRKPRQTRHHRLMDEEAMPKTTPLPTDKLNTLITRKCDVHPGKSVDYYCKSHNLFGCSGCFMSGHRSCKDIESIQDKAKSILNSTEYVNFVEGLKLVEAKSRDISSRAHQGIKEATVSIEDVRKSVKQLKQEMITAIERPEQQLNVEADNLQKENEEMITHVLEQCAVITDAVDNMKVEINALESSRRVCQLYIMLREQSDQLKRLQNKVNSLDDELIVRKYKFDPDTNMQALKDNVQSFGKITVELDREKQTNIDVKYLKDVRRCDISGIAILSSDRVIATDWNNRRIKLINTVNNTLISTLKVDDQPWDITVKDSLVAATLPGQRKILLLGINGDTLKISGEIKVQGECRGVAFINDKLLVTYDESPRYEIMEVREKVAKKKKQKEQASDQVAVALPGQRKIQLFGIIDDTLMPQGEMPVLGNCHGVTFIKDRLLVTYVDKPRLDLMDEGGKVVNVMRANNDDGDQLLKCPWYVCVSNDEQTVYVSDSDSNMVISFTLDGLVKSTYSDIDLNCPCGICVDQHGNVYVCGTRSRNVHQLSADLVRIKVLLTSDDLQSYEPLSISFCKTSSRLYVGVGKNGWSTILGTGLIKSFKLS